jgi:hypothetical protein
MCYCTNLLQEDPDDLMDLFHKEKHTLIVDGVEHIFPNIMVYCIYPPNE